MIEWYRSRYGTDIDSSEIASPVVPRDHVCVWVQRSGPLFWEGSQNGGGVSRDALRILVHLPRHAVICKR